MAAATAESGGGVPSLEHGEASLLAATDVDSSIDQTPDNNTASGHTHTESMVTVRLSSADKLEETAHTEEPQAVVPEEGRDSRELQPNPASTEPEAEQHTPEEHAITERISLQSQTSSVDEPNAAPEEQHAPDIESPLEDTEAPATEVEADLRSSTSAESHDDDSTLQNIEVNVSADLDAELEQAALRSRSRSTGSSQSSGSEQVDWAKLDKNEEQEERDDGTDESTAFLLARLEQENNAIATDPKSSLVNDGRDRKGSRPPSIQQIKKLVLEPTKSTLRYSTLPSPPPMTELEFWSALVRNYPQTAQRLPTLTANKIRNGIPPPLRGVVWMSIAGARDTSLEETYDKLCQDSSPYEKIIHKDLGRSFPGVDMFRDPDGEGQRMLGKVLNAFSLYDQEIGYCQGLGFVVGPLLMHMGDKEAFCTLVRLMDHYDLRSCFLPNLTGLHLRIYQYQQLLAQHLPELTAHLDKLNVEPLYISQWFLSFFGVTCPLPMLIRLYDVILTEGASETLMRVALSLMRRNEKRILAATEFEDVIQLLLSRALWDTYNYNADELISDFCNWTGLVTRESLKSLEIAFKDTQSPTSISKPSVHTAAQRFLGRLWNGSGAAALISPKSPSASSPLAPPRPASALRRTPSKQSMASTLNSIEGSEFSHATISTDATGMSRQFSTDFGAKAATTPKAAANKDKDLHGQIEELLKAMNNLQRENSELADQLQKEREERDEERLFVERTVKQLRGEEPQDCPPDSEEPAGTDVDPLASAEQALSELEHRFTRTSKRSSLATQTKHQLREEVLRWKAKYSEEASRSADLSQQLTDRERDLASLKEDLRDARGRIHDAHKDKQRLERTNQELRAKKPALDTSLKSGASTPDGTASPGGLRELRLGRSSTASANLQPQWSRRVSSLSMQSLVADEEQKPEQKAEQDALLLELANAKTAEAVAKQELEEMRTKLESFRKLLKGKADAVPAVAPSRTIPPTTGHSHGLSIASTKSSETEKDKPATTPSAAATTANMVGGFFSGWGKRTVSNG